MPRGNAITVSYRVKNARPCGPGSTTSTPTVHFSQIGTVSKNTTFHKSDMNAVQVIVGTIATEVPYCPAIKCGNASLTGKAVVPKAVR